MMATRCGGCSGKSAAAIESQFFFIKKELSQGQISTRASGQCGCVFRGKRKSRRATTARFRLIRAPSRGLVFYQQAPRLLSLCGRGGNLTSRVAIQQLAPSQPSVLSNFLHGRNLILSSRPLLWFDSHRDRMKFVICETYHKFYCGRGGSRTHMRSNPHNILSVARIPFRHSPVVLS